MDTMSRMPDDFVNLTVTSPPYNMRLRVRDGEYTEREKGEHFSKKYSCFDDAMPMDDYFEWQTGVLYELMRVSKLVIYNISIVTGSKEALFRMIGVFAENIHDVIIWDKGYGEPAMNDKIINRRSELLLIMSDSGRKGRLIEQATFDRGAVDDIWTVYRERNDFSGNTAIMPSQLAARAINYFSSEGDLVYDPFMGSGTTARMAHKYKRNWIGSEISEVYAEQANKLLKPYLMQTTLF